MAMDQNPHQTVAHFGCFGFSMPKSGFSVPQMQQFYLFTYPPRSKWASSEKMIFIAKIGIFCKSIAGPLPSILQAYTLPYSFGGRIKLIICQIRHELSVTIHEISTSWRKTLDGGPYNFTNVRGRISVMSSRRLGKIFFLNIKRCHIVTSWWPIDNTVLLN